ncbi:MAG TPA: response regulator transcription factor [Magnetospirillaceae bacterium]
MDEKRLLLVDQDGPLRRTLAAHLGGFGYVVAQTASGGEALAQAGQHDLLVVASAPADADALSLCDAWCNAGAAILVLTEDGDVAEPLNTAGALTLAKPVRLADLSRLVKDALRPAAAPEFVIGPLRFHPPTRELAGDGLKPIRLTEKEAAILAYLHRSNDRAVPRDELLQQIWGYADAIATHTLETHIYRLRRKLAENGPAPMPQLISDGTGYRLNEP